MLGIVPLNPYIARIKVEGEALFLFLSTILSRFFYVPYINIIIYVSR